MEKKLVKVIVTAQYYENYNIDNPESNLHWKPKGGVDFVIELNPDILFYSDPNFVFGKMLKKHCDEYSKYEYSSYEIKWQEPILLGTAEEFNEMTKKLFEASLNSI